MSDDKKVTVVITKQKIGSEDRFWAEAELGDNALDSPDGGLTRDGMRNWLRKFGQKAAKNGYTVTERWV